MTPAAVLSLELLVVLVGVVALAVVLRRRLQVPWRIWWWGALAFVGSQVVRLPFLAGLSLVARGAVGDTAASAANAAVLALTAGVFEETARWLVLRFGARDARRWREGVMFGAGHGGIEAVLVIGGAVAGSLALLAGGDAVLEAMPDADSREALATQLEAVREVSLGDALLALWERVLAITFHISLALLVLRSVRTRAWRWLLAAIAFHAAFNAVAVAVSEAAGIAATELALTVVTLLSVAIIVREHRADAVAAVAEPGAAGLEAAGPEAAGPEA